MDGPDFFVGVNLVMAHFSSFSIMAAKVSVAALSYFSPHFSTGLIAVLCK